MLAAQQNKTNEHSKEPQSHRHNRSPSTESVSRLHQQSGGFAQPQQRRGSFSKDNGYYQPSNGFRKQYNNQRGRSNQRNYQNQQMVDYHQNASNYGQAFQSKSQPNRSFQNSNQSYQKNGYYYQNQYSNNKSIFNSAHGMGVYSVRRPSPSSPSGAPMASLPPNPIRRVESNDEVEKIHLYRAAGTAPSKSTSSSSSPYKHQVPPQPPSTPSSDIRVDLSEEWHRCAQQTQNQPNQYRRGQHEIPAPINLQHKIPVPSVPIDITTASLPTTPSPIDRSQFRTSLKDGQMALSVDSVDAKHPCFADERMHSALYG